MPYLRYLLYYAFSKTRNHNNMRYNIINWYHVNIICHRAGEEKNCVSGLKVIGPHAEECGSNDSMAYGWPWKLNGKKTKKNNNRAEQKVDGIQNRCVIACETTHKTKSLHVKQDVLKKKKNWKMSYENITDNQTRVSFFLFYHTLYNIILYIYMHNVCKYFNGVHSVIICHKQSRLYVCLDFYIYINLTV